MKRLILCFACLFMTGMLFAGPVDGNDNGKDQGVAQKTEKVSVQTVQMGRKLYGRPATSYPNGVVVCGPYDGLCMTTDDGKSGGTKSPGGCSCMSVTVMNLERTTFTAKGFTKVSLKDGSTKYVFKDVKY